VIVVVGAGAAGLMAAIHAAGGPAAVLVLESTRDGGRKILVSGGGRCNVLPSVGTPERFVTDSPAHLLRGMLRSWSLVQQRNFFERDLGVPLTLEADTGKLFPASNRARDVRDALVSRARSLGVAFQFGASLVDLEKDGHQWSVRTTRGTIGATRVVLATGGLSVPATGSDGRGLDVTARLGHRVHPTYPALTPLVSESMAHAGLSGVSLNVRLRARAGTRIRETYGGFLFTHRGYSGPAVLDLSHVAVRSRERNADPAVIRVQWALPDAHAWQSMLGSSNGNVATAISAHVPQRLTAALLAEARVPLDRRGPDLRRDERMAIVERLTSYVLPWKGDEGFRKAEVTGGGVALDEVNPRTLESKRHAGLFLCGEMLDAFGPIGGHNFAWAWATGRLAGLGSRSPR
jgi:predicted Rossmann fold flavoprotein